MLLSRFALPCFVMLILVACGGDLKQYQKPENAAMSSVHVPLYEGITDIMADNSFTSLKPFTTVYFTGDKAKGNEIEYVNVAWGDSSGYARADMLLPRGRVAVLISPGSYGTIGIYENDKLGSLVSQINSDWELTVVGPKQNLGRQIFYQGMEGKKLIGYVDSNFALDDSINVAFYKAYIDAQRLSQQGNDEGLIALSKNPDFLQLETFQRRMSTMGIIDERGDAETGEGLDGDDVYGEGGAPYGDTDDVYSDGSTIAQFMSESDWYEDGEYLKGDDIPGTVRTFFVFEDDTEISAAGAAMASGYAWEANKQLSDKSVKAVRFEFTPARKVDVSFQVDTWCQGCENYNVRFSKAYIDTEPGKPYSVLVANNGENTMVLCSMMRVIVTVGAAEASFPMVAECGD